MRFATQSSPPTPTPQTPTPQMPNDTAVAPGLIAGAAPSAPAPSASSMTPDGRSTTFQPVEGGTETRSGTTLLVEAYVILWVILMTWLVMLWRKQASLNARLDGLETAIDKAAAANAASAKS